MVWVVDSTIRERTVSVIFQWAIAASGCGRTVASAGIGRFRAMVDDTRMTTSVRPKAAVARGAARRRPQTA